jgi:hypothetical protein
MVRIVRFLVPLFLTCSCSGSKVARCCDVDFRSNKRENTVTSKCQLMVQLVLKVTKYIVLVFSSILIAVPAARLVTGLLYFDAIFSSAYFLV